MGRFLHPPAHICQIWKTCHWANAVAHFAIEKSFYIFLTLEVWTFSIAWTPIRWRWLDFTVFVDIYSRIWWNETGTIDICDSTLLGAKAAIILTALLGALGGKMKVYQRPPLGRTARWDHKLMYIGKVCTSKCQQYCNVISSSLIALATTLGSATISISVIWPRQVRKCNITSQYCWQFCIPTLPM